MLTISSQEFSRIFSFFNFKQYHTFSVFRLILGKPLKAFFICHAHAATLASVRKRRWRRLSMASFILMPTLAGGGVKGGEGRYAFRSLKSRRICAVALPVGVRPVREANEDAREIYPSFTVRMVSRLKCFSKSLETLHVRYQNAMFPSCHNPLANTAGAPWGRFEIQCVSIKIST